jgi:hypothetical protein
MDAWWRTSQYKGKDYAAFLANEKSYSGQGTSI